MRPLALRKTADAPDRLSDKAVMAFAADDVTRQTLARLAAELGWHDPVIESGGVTAARRMLADSVSPNLLIVDVAEAVDPLAELNGLADVCEPGTRVVALGVANDVRLYRSLIEAGVVDYLVKPVSAADLQRAIAQADEGAAGGNAASARRGRVTAVLGARGGVGASMVALNLAWLLSHEHGRKTALVDFDLHFGTAALSLDLETGGGFRDVLQNPSRIDPLFLERASLRVGEKLVLLGTEESLTASRQWTPESVKPLLDELTQAQDDVVIDLPRGVAIEATELLAAADQVVVVADASLSSLRDGLRLKALVREAAPKAKLRVVVNRSRPGLKGELPVGELAKSLGEPAAGEIPYDPKAAAAAAAKGRPIVAVAKADKAAQALRKLAGELLPGKPQRRAKPFARLFRR